MKYAAILCLFLISACSTTPKVPAVPGTLEGVRPTLNVDARLLEDCEDFSEIIENPRPSDVLDQHGKDIKTINCWKTRHRALVKTVKDAFNIKEVK